MMVCKKCGTKFSEGLFCPECGTRMMPDFDEEGERKEGLWDAEAFGEGEYDAQKYGPQGQLEEQKITKSIKVEVGEKRIFENKKLIFEESITMYENARLELRNCVLVLAMDNVNGCAIYIWGKNVDISFESCCFKGNEEVINAGREDGSKIEFRNCAFICDGESKEERCLLSSCGTVYFENSFIRRRNICNLGEPFGSRNPKPRLELCNCTIIDGNKETESRGVERGLVRAEDAVLILKNCFIKSSKKLVSGGKMFRTVELHIENSYLDSYKCRLDDIS